MEEGTNFSQASANLEFRIGRIEDWIIKATRLQELRFTGAKELQTDLVGLGNAIFYTRNNGQRRKTIAEFKVPTLKTGKITKATLTKKGLVVQGKLNPGVQIENKVKCPGCGLPLKSAKALRSHITNPVNWSKWGFRKRHKELRYQRVWENA